MSMHIYICESHTGHFVWYRGIRCRSHPVFETSFWLFPLYGDLLPSLSPYTGWPLGTELYISVEGVARIRDNIDSCTSCGCFGW